MWLGVAALVVVALGLLASWGAGSLLVQGESSRVAPASAPSVDLRIETADHLSIAATFTPGTDDHAPGVLLLHGVGGSRAAVASNAAWLAGLGYAVLAIDFRGHGESTLAPRSFGLHEAWDAAAALGWLKTRQNGAPVAVIGISLGGAASLIGDAGPIGADAMILQAVYPDIRHAIRNRIASRLGVVVGTLAEPLLSSQSLPRLHVFPSRLSPLAALPRYGGPVLVIGGEEDRSTPPAETRALFAAARGPRELWLVPHGDHADICDLVSPAYRDHVLAFLGRAMARPR